jgi:hypothetical protein
MYGYQEYCPGVNLLMSGWYGVAKHGLSGHPQVNTWTVFSISTIVYKNRIILVMKSSTILQNKNR